jgi:hypothetical protein
MDNHKLVAAKPGRVNSQSGLPDDGRSPNDGLSFLRKQESRHFDRSGFRIKAGPERSRMGAE